MNEETREYCCKYFHAGRWWGLNITAFDGADAQARADRLNLQLLGELKMTVPAKPGAGLFVRFLAGIRNALGWPLSRFSWGVGGATVANAIATKVQAGSAFLQAGCSGGLIVANDAPAESDQKLEGGTVPFEVLQDDWIQIPYGQFPHPKGMQYFDQADAQRLTDKFNTLLAKLLRRFGGLPWYEGHPDTDPRTFTNKRAYGWIDDMRAGTDAFYVHVKWTDEGRKLKEGGYYKYFSPVWDAKPASIAGRPVLRPVELISVGFTNTPNMPVLPLSNEAEQTQQPNESENDMKNLPPFILGLLGFKADETPTDEQLQTACANVEQKLKDAGTLANEKESAETLLANEREAHTTALENAKKDLQTVNQQLDQTAKDFKSERHERIELIVANAINGGKIAKADADKWRTNLTENFDSTVVELANTKPLLKTEPSTDRLGERQNNIDAGGTPGEQLRTLANTISTDESISYDSAWLKAKRQRPDLAQAMQHKQATA